MFRKIGQIAAFLIAFCAPSAVYADSISTAINIVESFEAESRAALAGLDPKQTAVLSKNLSAERARAVDELKTLGWTHAPGDIRYRRTLNIVDSFTGGVIDGLQALNGRLTATDAARAHESIKRLTELKVSLLKELNVSRKNELAGEKQERPVPLIDRSPFDTTPGEPPGIWYR